MAQSEHRSKVLVFGGTGGVGVEFVRRLVRRQASFVAVLRSNQNAGEFAFALAVRSVNKAHELFGDACPPLFVGTQSDLMDSASLSQAISAYAPDVVVTMTGTRLTAKNALFDHKALKDVFWNGIRNLIDAIKRHNAHLPLVMVSSAPFMHPKMDIVNAFVKVGKYIRRSEEYLSASGLPHVIVRPGVLKDGEIDHDKAVLQFGYGEQGIPALAPIHRATVAECLIETVRYVLECEHPEVRMEYEVREKKRDAALTAGEFDPAHDAWELLWARLEDAQAS